eukprot:CAMPEP_0183825100 /NCGR_PEP_ID=MMETSP0807_2-20130328/948_1 /TAXON_ID=88271 /ORGANISM="Picocystis salinarum, Strain CCMP1897" /LENGTH=300 /DNA_ID=CAMNT_0026070069 /DNA_START=51 /DNA_END=954 /DNA_ORIENTATION=-
MAERGTWRDDRTSAHKVHGTFSEQEKETIRDAVKEYAHTHGLVVDERCEWLFDKKRRGVWKEVAKKLPDRTTQSVWACGVRMYKQVRKGVKWTPEEDEKLVLLVERNGKKVESGGRFARKVPRIVQRSMEEIKLGRSQKTGKWTEEEVQRLEHIVFQTIQEKRTIQEATQGDEGDTMRHLLHDINWNLVSEKHGTRNSRQCCQKWYDMKETIDAVGPWEIAKEVEMLENLVQLGAEEEFEVPWDTLVESVSSTDAKRHWKLLQRQIPRCTKRSLSLVGQAQYLLAARKTQVLKRGKSTAE